MQNSGTGGANEFNLMGLNAAGSVTSYIRQDGTASFSNYVFSPIHYGNSTASANLTLDSTSNATKGNIILAPSGGNVGIGTTSPSMNLDTNIGATPYLVFLGNHVGFGGVGASWATRLSAGSISAYNTNYQFGAVGDPGTSEYINFLTQSSTDAGGIERMRIAASGNVGIGTSSPNYKLEILNVGFSAGTGYDTLNSAESTSSKGIKLGYYINAGGTAVQEGRVKSSGSIPLAIGTTNYPQAIYALDTNGNVGIGTTSPGSLLHVSGNGANITVTNSSNSLSTNLSGNNLTFNRAGFSYINQATVGGNILFQMSNSSANDTNAMTILANGNVGIGTTNPTERLHIASASTTGSALLLDNSDTGGHTYKLLSSGTSNTNGAGHFRIYDTTAATDRLWISSTGNVGIGTTNPGTKLEVAGATLVNNTTAAVAGTNQNSPLLTVQGNIWTGSASAIAGWSLQNVVSTGSYPSTTLQFSRVGTGGGSMHKVDMPALSVSGNYNQGGGIAPLTVAPSFSAGSSNSNSAISVTPTLGASTTGTISGASISGITNGGNTVPTYVGLNVNVSGATTNYAALFNGGNVGIGTSIPDRLLSISGGNLGFSETATARGIYWGSTGSSAKAGISGQDGAASTLQFMTNSNFQMTILNNGNVGIGTTSPSYKLDVQGGDINASGSVRAAGVALTSDRRWKKNITPLKNSVEKIKQINGVSYDWAIDDFPEKHFSNRKQIGVIAQDVQAVFPELVLSDKEGYLSVNYPALIAPLIEAFKAQQKQIEANVRLFKTMQGEIEEIKINVAENTREIAAIKAENKAKDKEIAKLKQENASIKTYLCSKDKNAAFCK